jgi:hypothetical protein
MRIQFRLEAEVHDEAMFRQAARDKAIAQGLEEPEAGYYLDDAPIGDCAVMLYDPAGEAPPGASITASEADAVY